ncbi:hydantoinase B/oxoprolinase family protein, partial [Candidatus Bipolaricaulota bacterium]|nr:hydantoinase B/oxoprolinase family protein [Candidatus Bipolaricaulota bacterium]
PLRVERYELREDSSGAGEFRGGLGLRREIRVLEDGTEFSLLSDRRRHSPEGLHGGKPGSPGEDRLIRSGEEQEIPGKVTLELREGDVISIRTPGGGGYGKPADRRRERIDADVTEGRVSRQRAEEDYPQYGDPKEKRSG